MKTTMYPGNPYIENHNEIMGYDMPIGDALDMYDNEHGLEHNDLLRAQYCHWRSKVTGVPELLSRDYAELLGRGATRRMKMIDERAERRK